MAVIFSYFVTCIIVNVELMHSQNFADFVFFAIYCTKLPSIYDDTTFCIAMLAWLYFSHWFSWYVCVVIIAISYTQQKTFQPTCLGDESVSSISAKYLFKFLFFRGYIYSPCHWCTGVEAIPSAPYNYQPSYCIDKYIVMLVPIAF